MPRRLDRKEKGGISKTYRTFLLLNIQDNDFKIELLNF